MIVDLANPDNYVTGTRGRMQRRGGRLTLSTAARGELDRRVEEYVRGAGLPVKLQALYEKIGKPLQKQDARAVSWYSEIGASTQRLKQAKRIQLKKGEGGGWLPFDEGST